MFVVQRSGDMFAGIPYDICVFTNLLYYIACLTNLNPGVISHNVVDAHIYQDHFDGVTEYFSRPTHTPPIAQADLFGNIKLINYNHEGRIKINIAK
jgi:thymidylate synthase